MNGIYVAELFRPGICISSKDRDWAYKIEGLISSLVTELGEAAVSLNLFIQEHNNAGSQFTVSHETTINTNDEADCRIFLEKLRHAENASDILKIEIETKRKKWSVGHFPEDYKHRMIFIYSKTFLLSMHMIGKILSILAEDQRAKLSLEIKNHKNNFYDEFPHLIGIRNSEAHKDERLQGLAKNKPIDVKPINNGMIQTAGKMMIISSLNGTRFMDTLADGSVGELDVSMESLNIAKDCIQGVISAFSWEGHPQHYPS